MKRYISILAALLVAAGALASPSAVTAQERVVVEEREATVLKKIGRTVILRNDLGEIKQYSELPENVTLYVDGKPADIDDLREGMKLHGVRWANVPPPVVVTMEQVQQIEAAPAPEPAPEPTPEPAPAPTAPPAELPSTASSLPLVGLAGLLLALLGGGALLRRRPA